jgi:hypothetical protein
MRETSFASINRLVRNLIDHRRYRQSLCRSWVSNQDGKAWHLRHIAAGRCSLIVLEYRARGYNHVIRLR